MKATIPEVPARYYARLSDLLQRRGIETRTLLVKAGLEESQLHNPEAALRIDQVERLIHAALEVAGRSDLALDFGQAVKLSSHSILGYGMLSSPTVEYALGLAARFFRLIMPPFRMRYQRHATHIQLSFEPILAMTSECLTFHLETIAAATHWELRELLQGHMPSYDLYLSFPEPAHSTRYTELTGARCHFSWSTTPGLRMTFPVETACRPLSLADPAALQIAETRCHDMAQRVMASGNVSDWVAMMLREANDSMLTLTELAETLNLSARTLDRHLQKEQVSFSLLVRQARHERALALLENHTLNITQVAHELGYSDASNFSRAFRRETGMAPATFRQQQSAKPDRSILNSSGARPRHPPARR